MWPGGKTGTITKAGWTRLDKELNKREMLAKKTCWAIDADPKKPGKVKIIDQEHAAELLEMAKDYLA